MRTGESTLPGEPVCHTGINPLCIWFREAQGGPLGKAVPASHPTLREWSSFCPRWGLAVGSKAGTETPWLPKGAVQTGEGSP